MRFVWAFVIEHSCQLARAPSFDGIGRLASSAYPGASPSSSDDRVDGALSSNQGRAIDRRVVDP